MSKRTTHETKMSKARSAGMLRQCRAKTWDGQRESKRSFNKRRCRDKGRTRRGWE